MLAFAAQHDVKPLTKEFKMDEDAVAKAIEKSQWEDEGSGCVDGLIVELVSN